MGCLSLLWVIAVSHFVERNMNRIIAWGLKKWTRIEIQYYATILHLQNEFAVWEIKVGHDNWLAGKSLIDAGLFREGVLILDIQRKNGAYLGAPQGISKIHEGDMLVMYDPMIRLENVDRRQAGKTGDQEHLNSIAEHQKEIKAQRELDNQRKNPSQANPKRT